MQSEANSPRGKMTPKLRIKTPPFYTRDIDLKTPSFLRVSHSTSRRTKHTGSKNEKSELQNRLGSIVRRVIGTSHSHLQGHSQEQSPVSPSTALPVASITPTTSLNTKLIDDADDDDDDDDDDCSYYGDFEENEEREEARGCCDNDNGTGLCRPESMTSPTSLSSASSYSSLASLNPYVVDAADLGALLSPCLPPSLTPTPSPSPSLSSAPSPSPSPSPSPLVLIERGERERMEEVEMNTEIIDGKHARDSARLAQDLDTAHAAVVAGEDAALRELRLRTRLC